MFRWMLSFVFVVCSAHNAKSQDFEQATPISLDEVNQPLRDVLTKFEQQADVAFSVESIIPRKEELLASEITIKCETKPFWEAIALLTDAGGLIVNDFYRSTIVLKPKSKFQLPGGPVLVADPITQGPFLAALEKHEIFDQLDVVIRPEPWVGLPHVVSYEATVHFQDGQSITYQPKFLIWVYEILDEVSLRIEMDDWPKEVSVRQVDVTAKLQIGTDWSQIALPPVSQIASRETKVQEGIFASRERVSRRKRTRSMMSTESTSVWKESISHLMIKALNAFSSLVPRERS